MRRSASSAGPNARTAAGRRAIGGLGPSGRPIGRPRRPWGSRVRRCCHQHPLPSELHGRHFDACSSSIEQRPCEIRPGTAPPAHDTPYGTRLPHWPWGQPGRYCDRAGYRDRRGLHQRGSLRSRRQICFAPPRRLAVGSRPSTPEGSRPAFARGDVPTPIRPITGRLSLPPPSFTRRPMGSSCDSLSPMGRTTGLPRSADVPRWGGSPFFAGGTASAPGEFGAPGPDHVPFWPERISILRSFSVTTFITASRWVDPSTRSWSPTASMLAVAVLARA